MVEVHEFGRDTLVSDVLFDQLGFLVDHFVHCDSFGCSECRRYHAVQQKLMQPFVEVEYHGFALAERKLRSLNPGEQVLAVGGNATRTGELSTRKQ